MYNMNEGQTVYLVHTNVHGYKSMFSENSKIKAQQLEQECAEPLVRSVQDNMGSQTSTLLIGVLLNIVYLIPFLYKEEIS
jgi:hypothetical protein